MNADRTKHKDGRAASTRVGTRIFTVQLMTATFVIFVALPVDVSTFVLRSGTGVRVDRLP